MRSDTILDYAVFQLSPKHSRCELFVSSNGQTEKLASGLIQPFVNNLRVLEAQAAQGGQSSIRLEVEKSKDGETWFTKGTLERFVQFVCNPEVLERVSTFDLEMSQLEAARNLYSQGNEDRQYGGSDYGRGMADATKKELLRAIDLRLDAVKKDLTMAISNASASGFNPDSVFKLQLLADRFGAHRLDEACSKFVSLWQRRPYLIDLRNLNVNAQTSQSLRTPDMSVNEPSDDPDGIQKAGRSNLPEENRHHPSLEQADMTQKQNPVEQSEQQTQECPKSTKTVKDEKKDGSSAEESSTVRPGHTRRLSVQDRINLFESKQKENSNSGGKPVPPGKSTELRRLSSDVSSAPTTSEKSVLRRWSIVSDLSIDLASDKKLDTSTESPLCTPLSVPHAKGDLEPKESNEKDKKQEKGSGNDVFSIKSEPKSVSENVGYQGASNLRMKSSTAEVENKMGSGIQVTSGSPSESDIDSNHSSDAHVKGGVEFKVKDVQCHDTDENVSSQPQRRSFTGRQGKKEVVSSNKQSDTTDSQRAVSQKPTSADSEQRQKSSGGRDDGNDGNDRRVGQENMDRIPMTSMDQVQRTGQSKGYCGVNDELKMKANELEKLFAEHKLRVPGDQSSSSGYGKQAETGVVQTEQSFSSGFAVSEAPPRSFPDKRSHTMYPGGGSGDFSKLITPSTGKVVGDNGDLLRRNFSDLSFSDDSRGKFYEKYMQKRDAKLREEWSSNRAEKETKLKSMQEALEQSKSEMKAKFSGFSDKQNSLSSTRHRAEKFRSFNSRASMKKYQHPISSFQSEEDEDFSEYSDQKPRVKDKTSNGQAIGNNATSRSFQAKKLQPNRNVSSVNPRTTTTSIPKPSAKVSNTNSGRRRSEKPLAQSVPNFSDLKKENTKPSSLVAKTTTRTQGRNTGPVKQEKLRRSLRKSSSGNIEFTELSTLYSDDVLAPARVDTEKNQRNVIDVDHVAGFIQEVKATDTSENLKNEGYDELDSEVEVPKEEEPEELEMVEVEDDDEKPRMSEEYDQVDNTRTGDTTPLRSNSQIDSSSMTDLPATVSSTFHTVASLLDSPGESPLSWNSNMQHPFGYPNEHSDIDASMDSPIGSPASWSSRMRKKWGAAQNPAMIANSSQLQSRKDLTKGFKRLLKFGRKGRAAESFVDWVSVTTSEGDDDAEDRRDLANRSSDDLRKSRMGSLQSHLSEDGFHESEFSDQASNSSIHAPPSSFKLKEDHQISGSSNKAPRASFFSLSTFRNKGNDMKPR
ncbi:PREDICTED: uncharacterized protein LOC104808065 [Tarenaya hassleriana]|uniref:uncharacterized protein LOC104808065 n=1 Tax=Tarenaya hassleriana TaxID=28532 RepID=UPI00053C883E|nr:PREDICTED: uncharacterized protein LOC104808065 [Tarenaya hassleriana]